jgi:2-keto-3-deoxy-6-phosphogluconate aldolase
VNLDNVAEFFAAGASGVALGPEIFEPAAVQQKNIDVISGNASRFVEAIRAARRHTV